MVARVPLRLAELCPIAPAAWPPPQPAPSPLPLLWWAERRSATSHPYPRSNQDGRETSEVVEAGVEEQAGEQEEAEQVAAVVVEARRVR